MFYQQDIRNEIVNIVGAWKTDSGVHAHDQAFHLDVYPHEVNMKNNHNNEYSPNGKTDVKNDK